MGKINNVLFMNPNSYQHPPTPPIAAEYLGYALQERGVDCQLLDLCFSQAPASDIRKALRDYRPDAVFVTVRNVDTVLYPDTEFLLPQIREHIAEVRKMSQAPVVIGGAGMTAAPEEIRSFLGADIAVVGPGEVFLDRIIDHGQMEQRETVLCADGAKAVLSPGRVPLCDAHRYAEKGGLMGFRTHSGCSSTCIYCIESGTKTSFRNIVDVISELQDLQERGFTNLHLCDSEFNEDIGYCEFLLEAMVKRKLNIQWALYMKTGNFTERLFPMLAATGAYLITLTVDTVRKHEGYWKDMERMVSLARKNGIRLSVDLLTGFPHDTEDDLRRVLERVHAAGPDEVVVNTFIRLYRELKVDAMIKADPGLDKYIIGDDPSYLRPVFYNHIPAARLRELLPDGNTFRVAGDEKGVNYQRSVSSPLSRDGK